MRVVWKGYVKSSMIIGAAVNIMDKNHPGNVSLLSKMMLCLLQVGCYPKSSPMILAEFLWAPIGYMV